MIGLTNYLRMVVITLHPRFHASYITLCMFYLMLVNLLMQDFDKNLSYCG
jgi:hypothetical protein